MPSFSCSFFSSFLLLLAHLSPLKQPNLLFVHWHFSSLLFLRAAFTPFLLEFQFIHILPLYNHLKLANKCCHSGYDEEIPVDRNEDEGLLSCQNNDSKPRGLHKMLCTILLSDRVKFNPLQFS